VALAIGSPALRDAVRRVALRDCRYQPIVLADADVESGAWPAGAYAAMIASVDAARAYRRQRGHLANQWPVIVVLPQAQLMREQPLILATEAFVLTERINDLLPSIIALSADRLSVMPRHEAMRWSEADLPFLRIQQLSAGDGAILAE